MTEDQIKHMVAQFLNWRLPANFNPDNGITFEPLGNKGTANEYRHDPVGTNLLDATQAEAMVLHMIDNYQNDEIIQLKTIKEAALALSTAMVDSEELGADYELVDEEWIKLTVALETLPKTDGGAG